MTENVSQSYEDEQPQKKKFEIWSLEWKFWQISNQSFRKRESENRTEFSRTEKRLLSTDIKKPNKLQTG